MKIIEFNMDVQTDPPPKKKKYLKEKLFLSYS